MRATPRPLGSQFGWLWSAYTVSAVGTGFAFDAFSVIAILVLHAGAIEVSVLASAGIAAGALVAIPLGPWIEARAKRSVMILMDLARCAALLSVPLAYLVGWLTFTQLLAVSIVVGAGGIAFKAASGACLKAVVAPEQLVAANGRLQASSWVATMLGPPLGGAAIGLFGPVITVLADAGSYLLSAVGVCAVGAVDETRRRRPSTHPDDGAARAGERGKKHRGRELLAGWRYILGHAKLRALFVNTVLVNGLIMATAPLLAVLMLGDLGFSPLQYGLAFAVPCTGGLLGARLARPLLARFGARRLMLGAGTIRACWSLGLIFVRPGIAGLLVVMVVEFGLITSIGVFNPVYSSYRLREVAAERVARMLSAWSITSSLTIALFTTLGGLLASVTSPRIAIGCAGALMLVTPIILLRALRNPARRANSAGRPPKPGAVTAA